MVCESSRLPIPFHARLPKGHHQYEIHLRRCAGVEAKKKRPTRPEAIVLKYLTRYGAHLFGHPVLRDDDGTVIAVVARTNNPPEHFFSAGKQLLRHRVCRASLARDLQQQPAQVAFVANLQHPDYVSILCGSIDHLPEAFASLDRTGTIDPADIHLIRDHRDSHLDRLVKQLLKQVPPPESTQLSPPTWESSGHAEGS